VARRGRKFTPSIREFGYINRSRVSTKRPFDSLDIGTNIKIDPQAGIDLRDGYTDLFPIRGGWFEDTTLFSDRDIEANVTNRPIWIPVRRQCVLEGESGGNRYLFAAYCHVVTTLRVEIVMYRALLSATGVPTWGAGVVIDTLNLSGSAFTYLGNDSADSDQAWMEFSMAMNADKSRLLIAVVKRHDKSAGAGNNNYSTLRVLEKDSPYGAWGSSTTALVLDSFGATTITVDSDDAITHDIDIAFDSAGRASIAYGYYNSALARNEIHIRAIETDFYDSEPFALTAAGFDLYGCVMRYNTAKSSMMLFYVKSGAQSTFRFVEWGNSSINPMAEALSTQLVANGAVTLTSGNAKFANIPAISIDGLGNVHLLCRKNITGLYYVSYNYGTAVATPTDLSSTFSIEANDIPAEGADVSFVSYFSNWDMIVRGSGSTVSVHIYYTEAHATTGRFIRLCESFDGGDFAVHSGYVHVSHHTGSGETPMVLYFSADRTTISRANRNLIFLDFDDDVTGSRSVDFMHLAQMLDASLSQITIEMIHDTKLIETSGSSAQTKIVHCSNNRFYKRNSTSWHWEQLENTMDFQNDDESWWKPLDDAITAGGFDLDQAPDPVTHVRFKDRKSVIYAGYGVGEKLPSAVYQLINRKHFDNSGTYDYRDHFLDTQPLKAPDASILAPTVAGYDAIVAGSGRAVSNITLERFDTGVNDNSIYWNNVSLGGANAKKYRYASWRGGDIAHGIIPDDEFNQYISFGNSPDFNIPGAHDLFGFRLFYIGLTYIYDGYQESQMFVVPSDYIFAGANYLLADYPFRALYGDMSGKVAMGFSNRTGDIASGYDKQLFAITVNLRIPDLTSRLVGGFNPRITAVRIYLGEITDVAQQPKDVIFYPAKDVIISQAQAFKDELWNGEKQWSLSAGYWNHNDGVAWDNYLPVVIDVDDYLMMKSRGAYETINGHGDTFLDSTYGLTRSPFAESWHCAENFGNKILYGGVRIDGVDRPRRLLVCGNKVTGDNESVDTPDVCPDQLAIDMDFIIQAIGRLDDRTAVIIGDTGIAVLDLYDRTPRYLDKRYGVDSPDSISDMSASREGIAFLFKDHYSLFRGLADPDVMSSDVERDSDVGGITGISSITNKSDCWAFHIADARQLLLIFRVSPYAGANNPIFILDLSRKDGGWLQAWLTDGFKCGCVGIDEKLYWSNGSKVFQYPYGQTDNGTKFSPDVRLSDVKNPEGTYLDVERFYLTHNLTNAENLTATLIRDRNTALNIAHTITGIGALTDTLREVQQNSALNTVTGRDCKRSVSMRIQATQPTTFKIEELMIEGVLLERYS
jgi:hypothetical protein